MQIKKILECICVSCAKIKMDDSDPRYAQAMLCRDPRKRSRLVWELCKSRMVCEGGGEFANEGYEDNNNTQDGGKKKPHDGCGSRQPTIRREGLKFVATYKNGVSDDSSGEPTKQVLTAEKVYAILKRISDAECIMLGLDPEWARPDWFCITVLPVPPPAVRPSIHVDGASRGEDDLTYKLADIIKANASLKRHEAEGSPSHIIGEFEQLLQVI